MFTNGKTNCRLLPCQPANQVCDGLSIDNDGDDERDLAAGQQQQQQQQARKRHCHRDTPCFPSSQNWRHPQTHIYKILFLGAPL